MIVLGAAGLAVLSGCASDGQSPSLAQRPAELVAAGRIARSALPASSALPPLPELHLPLPADAPARAAMLVDDGRAAHARFGQRQAEAARLVSEAAGLPRTGDAWSRATLAVAALSAARSQTAGSLAELDQLYIAQRVDGDDGHAIAAVRDQVTAWVADEDAVLAGLVGRLGS